MNYQNYEDYMRSVLGYLPYTEENYTYTDAQEDLYAYTNEIPIQQTTQDLTKFYPEMYKMIYPMVCKVCNINLNKELTDELLENMIDEIYNNIEPEEKSNVRKLPPLKNGDVRNPHAKETEIPKQETRQTNFLLRDLIKILILKEWERPSRPTIRPPFQQPIGPNNGPSMYPPRPRNVRHAMGTQSPRPRYF